MTRTEFLSNCSKLSQVSVNGKQLSLSEKGKHHNDMGCSVLPGTERHAIQVWRKYGTLQNCVVFQISAEDLNAEFKRLGITFVAKPTKSGTMCRIYNF